MVDLHDLASDARPPAGIRGPDRTLGRKGQSKAELRNRAWKAVAVAKCRNAEPITRPRRDRLRPKRQPSHSPAPIGVVE